jgi:hypothetical protein
MTFDVSPELRVIEAETLPPTTGDWDGVAALPCRSIEGLAVGTGSLRVSVGDVTYEERIVVQ